MEEKFVKHIFCAIACLIGLSLVFFVKMSVDIFGADYQETQIEIVEVEQQQTETDNNSYYDELIEISKNDYTYEDIIHYYGLEKGFEIIEILEDLNND